MKYIVLQHPTKGTAIVAGLALTHFSLCASYVAQGYTAVSAGFFRFLERERFEVFGHSDSLGLSVAFETKEAAA